MDKKKIIEKILNDSLLMTNDINTFLFMRTEGYQYLKKYNLGGGNFISLLGSFSMLGFLAKVYFILKKGTDLDSKEKDYKEFKEKLKEARLNIKKYNIFVKPKRIGEINETAAFAEFITDYPTDIGLNKKNKSELGIIWNNYRNKLTHIVRLAKDNCAMTQSFPPIKINGKILTTKFNDIKNDLPSNKIFYEFENKEEARRKILSNPNNPLSPIDVFRFTSDTCYVDQLNSELIKMKNWIIRKLNSDEFPEKNISCLIKWLKTNEII